MCLERRRAPNREPRFSRDRSDDDTLATRTTHDLDGDGFEAPLDLTEQPGATVNVYHRLRGDGERRSLIPRRFELHTHELTGAETCAPVLNFTADQDALIECMDLTADRNNLA